MNEPKKKFKLVTDTQARIILPNTLTLIGVCVGLSSINFALNQRYDFAIISILFAAIIDGLDGRIARLIKGTSKVGKELDSLTDMISFGVAPAFIMYGENEIKSGKATLKNLESGNESSVKIEELVNEIKKLL